MLERIRQRRQQAYFVWQLLRGTAKAQAAWDWLLILDAAMHKLECRR
jgi:hypothetical protein